jgi:NAD(P)-dependent dehydrogenase (short-subunit alcohol dehydrogenase family)
MITIDHSGKGALVTGSGAGIGREIARWLSRSGARVVVHDLRADRANAVVEEINAEGGVAHAIVADARDDGELQRLVDESLQLLDSIDIAVNNVGMLPSGRGTAAFVEMDGAYWRDVVEQNLVVTALAGGAEARAMASGGVIVNVSSGETTRPSPNNAAYAAAKAAINHLTQSMAVELGPRGIRVVAIAPGTTATELVAEAFDDDHLRAIAESTPLRRSVDHDELARLTVFLASDLARCITGQLILADAGAHLSRNRPAKRKPRD